MVERRALAGVAAGKARRGHVVLRIELVGELAVKQNQRRQTGQCGRRAQVKPRAKEGGFILSLYDGTVKRGSIAAALRLSPQGRAC